MASHLGVGYSRAHPSSCIFFIFTPDGKTIEEGFFCLLLFLSAVRYFLRRRCNVIDRIGALLDYSENSIDFPYPRPTKLAFSPVGHRTGFLGRLPSPTIPAREEKS